MMSELYPEQERQPCRFVDILAEIRVEVHQVALVHAFEDKECKWYYNMTSTCHLIRQEALPIILKRSWFRQYNFQKFVTWTKTGDPNYLLLVRQLGISLNEEWFQQLADLAHVPEDLHNFLIRAGSLVETRYGRKTLPSLPASASETDVLVNPNLSANALASAWSGIKSLPNVQSLQLKFSLDDKRRASESGPRFRPEQELVLEMVSAKFSKLRSLTVVSDLYPLEYLQRFKDLTSLSCSGHSLSSPLETLAILRSLKFLLYLKISESDLDKKGYLARELLPFKSLSITSEVIAQMIPLKSIEISASSRFRCFEITPPLMQSLLAHATTLRDLRIIIRYSYPLDMNGLKDILEFASFAPINNIKLNLVLPEHLASVDMKSISPTTMKTMDIFAYTANNLSSKARLEINTGAYLPTEDVMYYRATQFEERSGLSIPCLIYVSDEDAAFMVSSLVTACRLYRLIPCIGGTAGKLRS